jgi:ubiquinone/menaquinone biosynthesis C-methylase UbiE
MSSTQVDLRRKMDQVIEQYGEWTAMNIHVGEDVYTIDPGIADERLRRFMQIARDTLRRPLHGLKVLDLACCEGIYAIEFALQGAETVGIELREANLAKARFSQEALGLDHLKFIQDDVKNVSKERYGEFDLVLCSGILYHLDAPDVFGFLENVADVCGDLLIIDTYVSARPEVNLEHRGRTYSGRYYSEHDPKATAEEKLRDLWAAVENTRSFWLTKPSLLNLLSHLGFTTVFDCEIPAMGGATEDRITLVAFKGEAVEVISSPATNEYPVKPVPEVRKPRLHPSQDRRIQAKRKAGRFLPKPLKRGIKSALIGLGLMKREVDPNLPFYWAEPWKRRH